MMGAMRIRIDCAYDGTDFHGWAVQPDGRTVQGTIEQAIATVLRVDPEAGEGPVRLVVAGRTDAGVHAAGQVCHADIDEAVLARAVGHMDVDAPQALGRRLARILPPDVTVLSVTPAPAGFDARFSALERVYVYRLRDGARPMDPRIRGFVWDAGDQVLDMSAMNEAASLIPGLHDFGSFATPNPGGTTIRDVKSARWERVPAPLIASSDGTAAHGVTPVEGGLVTFTITADAFARSMVRSLVGALVQVGRGRKSVDWFAGKLARPRREGASGPAPALGLTFEAVHYPPAGQLAARAEAIRAVRTL